MKDTSARIKQSTKEEITKVKDKFKHKIILSDDEVINHWRRKAELYDQENP